VVFADYIGYTVIFYKKYDGASSQWEPDLQLTTATSGSYEPQLATDIDNLVYLVWYDYRCGTGQEEVFFKQTLPTGIEEIQGSLLPPAIHAHPNPFTAATSIKVLGTSKSKTFDVCIYDITGRMVRLFSLGHSNSQLPTEVIWDGTDHKGAILASGVYFYRFTSKEGTAKGKLIKLQ
jgi:hypothetical protein